MDILRQVLSWFANLKVDIQPYFWLVYVAIGLFLFFKIFKIQKKLRKRFHDYWEDLFLSKQESCILEIKIPQALEKTPLGMEQIFAGLHGTAKGVTKYEVEAKGYLETAYSFELASIEGKIHFFIRGERRYRTTMEALVYAQFPEVEIQEVEDYTQDAPKTLPNSNYQLAAAELILEKPDAYPVRTYQQFELRPGREAEYVVDPFAAVMEAMSAIGEGEQMWAHCVIGIPMFSNWREDGQEIIDKIMGRETEKPKTIGFLRRLIHEIIGFGPHINTRMSHLIAGGEYVTPEETPLEEDEKKQPSMAELGFFRLSPGERELCLAIERNISKLGFYTMLRLAYFAPNEIFNSSKAMTLIGSFLQFNDKMLNSFKSNPKLGYTIRKPDLYRNMGTNYNLFWKYKEIPYTRKKLQALRMREIYRCCKNRAFGRPMRGHKGFILNTEELATIFHFPMKSVLTPELPRVEAKRGGPPARLPVD